MRRGGGRVELVREGCAVLIAQENGAVIASYHKTEHKAHCVMGPDCIYNKNPIYENVVVYRALVRGSE